MFKRLSFALLSLVLASSAFAAIDINKADQAQLESIKGIGPAMSTRILDERKKGPFKDWNDVKLRVKGVGPATAAKFSKEGLTVSGAVLQASDAPPPAPAKP